VLKLRDGEVHSIRGEKGERSVLPGSVEEKGEWLRIRRRKVEAKRRRNAGVDPRLSLLTMRCPTLKRKDRGRAARERVSSCRIEGKDHSILHRRGEKKKKHHSNTHPKTRERKRREKRTPEGTIHLLTLRGKHPIPRQKKKKERI